MARTSTKLPADPDIQIDASRDPLTPGYGDPDDRPMNLAAGTSVEVGESNGAPPWNRDHWYLDGSESWAVRPIVPSTNGLTIYGVIDQDDDQSENFQRVYSLNTSGGSPRIEVTAHDGDIRIVPQDSDGDILRAVVNDYSADPGLGAFVATVDLAAGTGDMYWYEDGTIYHASDANSNLSPGQFDSFDRESVGGGSGRNFEGKLYNFERIPRAVNASEAQRLIAYLREQTDALEDPRVKVPGARIDNDLPGEPDVHIAADEDPTTPADNNGDRAPLNLAPAGSEVLQTNGTNQPIWKQNVPGLSRWDFDGDDYWKGERLDGLITRAVYGCVFRQSSGFKYVLTIASSSNKSLTGIRADTGNTVGMYVRNDSGTSTVNDVSIDTSVWTSAVGLLSMNGTHYITARNENGETNSGQFTQAGQLSESSVWIGRRPGGAELIGSIVESWVSPHNVITQSDADNFRDYLAAKWGLI